MAAKQHEPTSATQRGTPMESLCAELSGLGFSPYQARVLAALLQVETANSVELARLSRVPRTSTYKVLEALAEQGLVERLPTIGPAAWTCHTWKAVVRNLEQAGKQHKRDFDVRLTRLRKILTALSPPTPSGSDPKR